MPDQDNEQNTEESRLRMVQELRNSVEMGSTDLFRRMRLGSDFTYGDQWDPADRSLRTGKKKFVLSIPLIKQQVKKVVGQQIENPKELSVIANRSGTKTGAAILTKVAKHAQDSEYVRFERTHWFEAGLANTVGFIGLFIDMNTDPRNGNLILEKLNEFECGIDPNCNVYDFNSFHHGAKCFIWEPWIDKDLIHAQYPKIAAELRRGGPAPDAINTWRGMASWLSEKVRRVSRRIDQRFTTVQETREKFKYHVTHTWYRKPKRVFMLYDAEKSELDAELVIKDKDMRDAERLVKESGQFEIEEVIRNIMKHHFRVGGTVLEEKEDELNGVDMYPIVAFSPYFDNGYRGGLAEDLVGTQQEINFTHSTKMDLLKKMPNRTWRITKDTGTYAADLQEAGNVDGFVVEEAKGGGKVEQMDGVEIPASLDRFEELSIRNMSLITGIQMENQVKKSSNVSGKALLAREDVERRGNNPILLNFDYSQLILNNLIIEVIRANRIYSADEIIEIVGADEMIDGDMMQQAREMVRDMLREGGRELPEAPPPPDLELAKLNQAYVANYLADVEAVKAGLALVDELAAPIARELLIEEISNLVKGRYNTTVAATAYTPSMRSRALENLLAIQKMLIETGAQPMPARRLILATDAKDAELIVQEMEQSQQVQQPQQAVA